VITATVASWFVDRISDSRISEERREASLSELLSEIQQLREEVAALREQSLGSPPRGPVPGCIGDRDVFGEQQRRPLPSTKRSRRPRSR
jgi:hypothetical protein